MNIRKWITVAGMALGLLLSAGAAHAAQLDFEDDDIDFHLDSELRLKSGDLVAGDVLVAVFEIPVFTVDGVNAIPAGKELTGVSAIQIESLVQTAFGPVATFVPYSGGLNEVLALGTSGATVIGGEAGGGAMLAMWFNNTDGVGGDTDLDVNRATSGLAAGTASCTSLSDCVTQASLGELFQVDGFLDDPDEFWISNILRQEGLNSEDTAALGNTVPVASFNAALSTLFHNGPEVSFQDVDTGVVCGTGLLGNADNCVQVRISGQITGGAGLDNGAFAHSDFDAVKHTIPEPSILGLLGIGLMGIFLARRRQRA